MPYFIVQTSAGIPKDPNLPVLTVIYAASQSAIPANDTYVSGPYGKQTAANAALKAMGGGPGSLPSQVQNAKGPSIPNPLSGVAAIGDFFNKLAEGSTWIRVAEVLLGLGLIVVGLAKLASGTSIGRAATNVGKAAAIL